jgi:cytochrome P450
LRALSQAAFTRKSVEHLIAPTLEIADRALDRICEAGQFEFINDYSSQITVGLLFRTMGLPERDHAEIRRKVILAVSTDKSVKGRTPEHIASSTSSAIFFRPRSPSGAITRRMISSRSLPKLKSTVTGFPNVKSC